MGSCYPCFRSLMVFFNFLFVIIGFGVSIVSLYTYIQLRDFNETRSDQYENLQLFLLCSISVGGLTILVGMFGCCGAYHESQCLLAAYFVCLFAIFGCELAAGIVGFVYKTELKIVFDKGIEEDVAFYRKQLDSNVKLDDPMNIISSVVDWIQIMVQCCGYTGWNSYHPLRIPTSCCNLDDRSKCDKSYISHSSAYSVGCRDKYIGFLENKLVIITIVALVCVVIEFLALLISTFLCCHMRSKQQEYNYIPNELLS